MDQDTRAVLVVDDDTDLLGMVEIMLRMAGYRVVTATEGEEALRRVAEEMPRMILLDMKMPGTSGWEFARELRARYKELPPIVVFTAAEDAQKTAEEIGADGYLGKSSQIDELTRTVERHLAHVA